MDDQSHSRGATCDTVLIKTEEDSSGEGYRSAPPPFTLVISSEDGSNPFDPYHNTLSDSDLPNPVTDLRELVTSPEGTDNSLHQNWMSRAQRDSQAATGDGDYSVPGTIHIPCYYWHQTGNQDGPWQSDGLIIATPTHAPVLRKGGWFLPGSASFLMKFHCEAGSRTETGASSNWKEEVAPNVKKAYAPSLDGEDPSAVEVSDPRFHRRLYLDPLTGKNRMVTIDTEDAFETDVELNGKMLRLARSVAVSEIF